MKRERQRARHTKIKRKNRWKGRSHRQCDQTDLDSSRSGGAIDKCQLSKAAPFSDGCDMVIVHVYLQSESSSSSYLSSLLDTKQHKANTSLNCVRDITQHKIRANSKCSFQSYSTRRNRSANNRISSSRACLYFSQTTMSKTEERPQKKRSDKTYIK